MLEGRRGDAEPTCTSVIRPREDEAGVRLRGGKAGEETPDLRTVPADTNGSTRYDPPVELGPRLGPCLENRPGRDSCAEPWREIGDLASSTWRGVFNNVVERCF